MDQGQVVEQPVAPFANDHEAAQAALSIIQKSPEFQEEAPPPKPRDERGKFVKEEQPPAKQAEQPEEKPEAEEAPEETPEEKPALKFKVKYKSEDGADVEAEVDQDELVKGYMLEKSYRQKTAQIAREREALAAKIKEAVDPKLKEYEDKLETVEQAIWHTLMPEIKSIDWNKLATENPAEWAVKYQRVQQVNAQLAQIQSERRKIAEQRESEQKSAFRKAAQEAVETLQERIPGWNQDLYGKVLKTGREYGFKAEEVNAITDHRAIEVLHDAMKWRELKAAKPATQEKKVTPAPKVVKPGAGEKPDQNADKVKASRDRLHKSGRMEDAVEWAKHILERS